MTIPVDLCLPVTLPPLFKGGTQVGADSRATSNHIVGEV